MKLEITKTFYLRLPHRYTCTAAAKPLPFVSPILGDLSGLRSLARHRFKICALDEVTLALIYAIAQLISIRESFIRQPSLCEVLIDGAQHDVSLGEVGVEFDGFL